MRVDQQMDLITDPIFPTNPPSSRVLPPFHLFSTTFPPQKSTAPRKFKKSARGGYNRTGRILPSVHILLSREKHHRCYSAVCCYGSSDFLEALREELRLSLSLLEAIQIENILICHCVVLSPKFECILIT